MVGVGNVREAFAAADARRLYAVRVITQAGDGLFQASLASAVFFNPEQATNPRDAALGFIVFYLPYSVVGPFLGIFLDRWQRTRVAVLVNVVRAFAVVAAMSILLTLGATSGAFYAGALVCLGLSRFYLASLSAAVPHVVPTPRLVTANAVLTTSGTVAAFTIGIVALILRDHLGAGITGNARFGLLGGAAYLVAAVVARQIRSSLGPDHPSTTPLRDGMRTVLRDMGAGGRHVTQRPVAARALAVITAHRFSFGLALISTVLLYRNTFHDAGVIRGGQAGLAQAVAATTIGVLAAAFVTPRVTRRISKPAWVTRLLVIAAIAVGVLAPTYQPAAILVASALLGFVGQALRIAIDTIVQETVADDFRGRVFSFYDTLFNLALVASAAVAAFVLPTSGKSYAVLTVITVSYALAAVGYAVASRRSVAEPA